MTYDALFKPFHLKSLHLKNRFVNVIDGVKAAGGAMAPQIWHMGVHANHASGWVPSKPFEGPSDRYALALMRSRFTEPTAISSINSFGTSPTRALTTTEARPLRSEAASEWKR